MGTFATCKSAEGVFSVFSGEPNLGLPEIIGDNGLTLHVCQKFRF
jgi:hypothetical protein